MLIPSEVVTSEGEARFNYVHSSLRTVIERVFGVFKGMWKIFALGKYTCAATGELFTALAVIHNIIIEHRMDISEYMDDDDTGSFNTPPPAPTQRGQVGGTAQAQGTALRRHLIERCAQRPDLVVNKK